MNTTPFQQNQFQPTSAFQVKGWAKRSLLLLFGCSVLAQVNGQSDKRLTLADQYFTSGDYYTAAGLYGQFLKPVSKTKSTSDFPLNSNRNGVGRAGNYKSRNDIMFRQAESYRLANYWNEAAGLYQNCYDADPSKYASALYWRAVCQRSVGSYDSAEATLQQFFGSAPAGHTDQQAAKREKDIIGFIKSQLSRPDTVLYQIQKLASPLGNEKGMFAPLATADMIFTTSTQADATGSNVNPYHNRLFQSAWINGSLQNTTLVTIEGLDLSANQGAATLSADGNRLYFTQWKKEADRTVSYIYFSDKTATGWGKPTQLTGVNQTGYNSKQPFCSADGKYLFFSSDRPGGKGGFDIWYAPLQANGKAGTPVNAGSKLNTTGNEQSPFYHGASETLVFSSDGRTGMGGYDLFTSKGQGTEWNAPENMGYPVNSSRDDVYFFSFGTDNLLDHAFFSSDRGSECCLSTYTVTKAPKKKMMAGFVRDCADNVPLEDVAVVLKDANGQTIQTRTGADGRYHFAWTGNDQGQLSLAKEQYNEKQADVMIESRNETAWHTDTLFNSALCLEKPAPVLVIKPENVVKVYFDFNQHLIRQQDMAILDSVYAVLVEDATATIQISAYTDGKGSADYNRKLSDKRARACADYLIQKGVDPARISFASFGACCPEQMELIDGKDNPQGRNMNRRALINISRQTP